MLLGLVGKAGSGKDTVADHLCKEHGFVKRSFAAPLKETLANLFAMSHEQLYDQELKEVIDERYGFTPRWLLQHFGTDVCRRLYPHIWVDHLTRTYFAMRDALPDVKVVVSDTRFLNEATAIRDAGGYVWRVVCKNNPKEQKLTGEEQQHASEVEQEKIETDIALVASFGAIPLLLQAATDAYRQLQAEHDAVEEVTKP